MESSPHELAIQLVQWLEANQRRIVFAESCTGGLVAATMASIPGVSEWLCGSAVTYREQVKVEWLGVDRETIDRHSAVSQATSKEMAQHVLAKTSEANLAVAITGHLGPNAPGDLDGVCFGAVAGRDQEGTKILGEANAKLAASSRIQRQRQATAWLLSMTLDTLRGPS